VLIILSSSFSITSLPLKMTLRKSIKKLRLKLMRLLKKLEATPTLMILILSRAFTSVMETTSVMLNMRLPSSPRTRDIE